MARLGEQAHAQLVQEAAARRVQLRVPATESPAGEREVSETSTGIKKKSSVVLALHLCSGEPSVLARPSLRAQPDLEKVNFPVNTRMKLFSLLFLCRMISIH